MLYVCVVCVLYVCYVCVVCVVCVWCVCGVWKPGNYTDVVSQTRTGDCYLTTNTVCCVCCMCVWCVCCMCVMCVLCVWCVCGVWKPGNYTDVVSQTRTGNCYLTTHTVCCMWCVCGVCVLCVVCGNQEIIQMLCLKHGQVIVI